MILNIVLLIWQKEFYTVHSSGKNSFAEVSKNLARYRFEYNFVWPSK